MELPQALQEENHTEDDYYGLPENIRAELIDGHFYNMAAPSRIHQKILGYLYNKTTNYIDAKDGVCEASPAPFAVRLFNDRKTIVEPDISVICDRDKLTDRGCSGAPDWIIEIVSPGNPGKALPYSFGDEIKDNIFEEFRICLKELTPVPNGSENGS